MPGDETQKNERRETIQELSDLLAVAEEMGQRLLDESHGEAYDNVYQLVDLFRQCRKKVDQMQEINDPPASLSSAES